jgi:cytochrome P450 family 2 subfamily U polypeptide 1
VFWILSRNQPNTLPHRRGWPIVGNLFQVPQERPELTFSKWSKELGPVFSVKLFNMTFVVVNTYETINDVLLRKASLFHGRPNKISYIQSVLSEGDCGIVFGQPGTEWRKLRKICHQKIRMYDTGLKRIEGISNEMTQTLVEEFSSYGGQSFNPKDIIYHIFMNVMMALLLGEARNKDDTLFKMMVEYEQTVLNMSSPSGVGRELNLFPWLRYFGNKAYKKLMRLCWLKESMFEMMSMAVEDDDEMEDDVRLMSALKKAAIKDPSLTEAHCRCVSIVDTFAAGTTTSTNTLHIYLNIISHHEDIQKKLQDEVNKVVGRERMVSLTDKEDMPYTHATLLELLRFTSIVPLGVPHWPESGATLNGYTISPGSVVLLNLFGLHHDEELWEKPFEFNPDRFLDASGEVVSASHPNRRHLMAFGAGPRVCLGEVLAKSRLFLIIATLAQKFNLRPGNLKASFDPRELKYGGTLLSKEFEIITESTIY